MGCDIHLVLEKRYEDKWIGVHNFPYYQSVEKGYMFPPATSRNYRRFAALAGVRGDGPDPLGLPSEASELTLMEEYRWGSDGHSWSWLPLVEAAKIFLDTTSSISDLGRKYPEHYFFGVEQQEGYENFRIVFWFDN